MPVAMKYEPGLTARERRAPDAADFARAKTDYASGAGVAHSVVGQWLLTWGQPGRKTFGDWLQEQNG